MKRLSVACLLSIAVLTGCSSNSLENTTPTTTAEVTAGAVEGAKNPIEKASEVSLVSNMNAIIQAIETERATTGQIPTTVPAAGIETIGQATVIVQNSDRTEYCLQVINENAGIEKTYFSSEGKIRDGGTCNTF